MKNTSLISFSLFDELKTKFNELGFKLYIVGGAIRDYLLGYKIYDIDLASNIDADVLFKNFNVLDNSYRSKFYSYTILYKDFKFELTLFRKDLLYFKNRYALVSLCNTLKEDSLRRDFTINALYYDGLVIDPRNGLSDLRNRTIRFIGCSKKKVIEDPIRILRALYFSLKLDFKIYYLDLIVIKKYFYLLKKYKSLSKKYISSMLEIDYIKSKKLLGKVGGCYLADIWKS